MKTDDFEPGDLVALKSGGPCMTIDTLRDDGEILCVWFVRDEDGVYNNKPLAALFKPGALERTEKDL